MTFREWKEIWAPQVKILRLSSFDQHLKTKQQVWVAHVSLDGRFYEVTRTFTNTDKSYVESRPIESAHERLSDPAAD
jgi:hypothetical protein